MPTTPSTLHHPPPSSPTFPRPQHSIHTSCTLLHCILHRRPWPAPGPHLIACVRVAGLRHQHVLINVPDLTGEPCAGIQKQAAHAPQRVALHPRAEPGSRKPVRRHAEGVAAVAVAPSSTYASIPSAAAADYRSRVFGVGSTRGTRSRSRSLIDIAVSSRLIPTFSTFGTCGAGHADSGQGLTRPVAALAKRQERRASDLVSTFVELLI